MKFEIEVECHPLPSEMTEHFCWDSTKEALDDWNETVVSGMSEYITREFSRRGIEVKISTDAVLSLGSFKTFLRTTLVNPPSDNVYDFLEVFEHAVATNEETYYSFCDDIGMHPPKILNVTGKEKKPVAGVSRGHVHHFSHFQLVGTGGGVVEVVKCVVCGELGQRAIEVV